MVLFGYELEFCGSNLVELSCAMQIPLKPKGKYKNYDTFHLEPEENYHARLKWWRINIANLQRQNPCITRTKRKTRNIKTISCLYSRKIPRHCHSCAFRENLFKRLKNLS